MFANVKKKDYDVILVSSGAAAVGQSSIMNLYDKLFIKQNINYWSNVVKWWWYSIWSKEEKSN